MNDNRDSKNGLALVVAWTFVLVPTLWGVTQTVIKSLALFR
ncbi:MAG: hypothetical protein ABI625_28330 [bacterium]